MTSPVGGLVIAVPQWLSNLAALGWRLVVIVGLLVVLWYVASVLWTVTASIAVAIVISAAFSPYVVRLRAQGRSPNAAAAIVWAAACLTIAGLVFLVALAFLPDVLRMVASLSGGVNEIHDRLAQYDVPPLAAALIQTVADAIRGALGGFVLGVVAQIAGILTVLLIAGFLLFFFLRDGSKAWNWIFQGFTGDKRTRIDDVGENALARVGGYLRGTTVLAAIVAVTDLVFMVVLGVPLALALAVLAFLCGYIPIFGGIIASGAILLVTIATQGWGAALVLLILLGIRNVILSFGLRPAIYGHTVNVHPALVLIALPAGYELAGIIGVFAAVPVTAILIVVARAAIQIIEPDPRPQLPGIVPSWLDRLAQWSWRILIAFALVAVLVAGYELVPTVALPLALGLIVAATCEPAVEWLIKRDRSRARAATIVVGGGTLVIIGVIVVSVLALLDQTGAIANTAADGAQKIDSAASGWMDLLVKAVQDGGVALARSIVGLFQGLASFTVTVVLSILLAYYMLADGPRLVAVLGGVMRPDDAARLRPAASRAFTVLGGYMIGTAIVSFVGAFSQYVIMIVLGLPLALPVFVLSFLLCFIPYIGGFISTGIAFLIAVSVGSTVDVVIMVIWTAVFNIVQGNVAGPIVYNRTVSIHPAITLVAVPGAGAVAGILGMFLVIPVIGVVATTWRAVLNILGGTPDSAPTPEPPPPKPSAAVAKEPIGGVAPAPT